MAGDEQAHHPSDPRDSDQRLFDIEDRFIDLYLAEERVDVDSFCADQPPYIRETVRERCEEFLRGVESAPRAEEPVRAPEIRQLADYRILRELGRGGMGVVFLAWQSTLRRTVALKVMHPGTTSSERSLERFRREGIAAGKLQHPYIVRILGADESGGVRYLAMDLVEGRSLADELRALRERRTNGRGGSGDRKGFGDFGYNRRVARIVQRTAEALHHAHEHGVIHRDIKPQNILVREGDIPCIVDFGLAKEVGKGSLSLPGEMAGTYRYMSPEQVLAKRVGIDHRTDVFSLGAVLYEMLTLTPAFDYDEVQKLLYAISFKDPERVRKLSPRVHKDLETICLRALEKDPARRFGSMADMGAELHRFLHNEPLRIRPTLQIVRWTRAILRSRSATLAAALVILLLVALPVVYAMARAHERAMSSPRLTITGVESGLPVYLRSIDMNTGSIGPEKLIGRTPLAEHVVRPGYYRIVVDAGQAYCELTRHFPNAGAVHRPEVWLRPTREVAVGMVRFPAGAFEFGTPGDDKPLVRVRRMTLESFSIDKHEVSIGDYKAFLRARGMPWPAYWRDLDTSGRLTDRELFRELTELDTWDQRPMTGIGIEEARAYAEWRGKRLPTLFEWERAGRGTRGRPYPWGSEPEPSRDRVCMSRHQRAPYVLRSLQNTCGVGAMPDGCTPEGIAHLLGNVSEWTETVMPPQFSGWDIPMTPAIAPAFFFVKGGGWNHPIEVAPSTYFDLTSYDANLSLTSRNNETGFRCAKSARK